MRSTRKRARGRRERKQRRPSRRWVKIKIRCCPWAFVPFNTQMISSMLYIYCELSELSFVIVSTIFVLTTSPTLFGDEACQPTTERQELRDEKIIESIYIH